MADPVLAPKEVGAPSYFWKDAKGKRVTAQDETTPGPKGGTQFREVTYEDGKVYTYKWNGKDWVQDGPAVLPKTNETMAREWRDKVDAATKAAAEQERADRPRLLGEATSSGPYRSQYDPKTGKVTAIEDPAYAKNRDTPEGKAEADQKAASAESSRAGAEYTRTQTGKVNREEGERAKNQGLTASESVTAMIARRQQEWKEYTDSVKQDFDNRKISFDEAQGRIQQEHNRLSLLVEQDRNKIAQRGQDITARGQSLDFAERMGSIGVAQLPYQSDRGVSHNIDESIKAMGSGGTYQPQYGPSEGRLQGMSPIDIVNAALAGISPNASPAPAGGFVAPPAVPGQVSQTPIPPTGPGASYGPPTNVPQPPAAPPWASVQAPSAMDLEELQRRGLAVGGVR